MNRDGGFLRFRGSAVTFRSERGTDLLDPPPASRYTFSPMDLDRLRIDRSAAPRPQGRGRLPAPAKAAIWIVVLLAAGWVLRRPLRSLYDRVTLPGVAVARAVKTSPLAASAVAGTAANGYVVAARRAALSADTPGRIVAMNVEEGSVVHKGDVVARLYADEYEAALRRAEAELAAAEATVGRRKAEVAAARTNREALQANVEAARARVKDAEVQVRQAEIDYRRATDLVAKGAGIQQDADDARTALDSAQANLRTQQALLTFAEGRVAEATSQVAVAEAAIREAEARVAVQRAQRDQAKATLDKTEVRAPFDGVVVLKDAEVGEVVSPNAQGSNSRGAVVTMVDFASLEVQVDMPETTLSAVKVGTPASIYLDAYPQIRYAGRVSRIWPTANRQKGTVELRVSFDAPDERLRPEMGVRVVFGPEGGEAETAPRAEAEVVLVPESCVTRVDGNPGVFELERDVARWRRVELGEARGGRVVVKAGLQGGETLVADPPADLADGARVRVVEQ